MYQLYTVAVSACRAVVVREQREQQANAAKYVKPIDDNRASSLSLAGRVVLQVDQTASSYQSLLRYLGECGSNLKSRSLCRSACWLRSSRSVSSRHGVDTRSQ